MDEFSESWPQHLRDLYWRRYRAIQKVRNLESHIRRIDPREFERVMDALEQANKDLVEANFNFSNALSRWNAYTASYRFPSKKARGHLASFPPSGRR